MNRYGRYEIPESREVREYADQEFERTDAYYGQVAIFLVGVMIGISLLGLLWVVL